MILPLSEALGWTFLHSLWQGGVLLLGYVGLRHLLRTHAPSYRYVLGGMTLASLCLSVGITFWQHIPASIQAPPPVDGFPLLGVSPTWGESASEPGLRWEQWLDLVLPWIGAAWVIGIILLLLRWSGSLWHIRQLRTKGHSEAPVHWQVFMTQWQGRWKIRRRIRLLVSSQASSPLTLGFFRPVILIPVSLLPGLSPAQWEAILLHELAHIRRADYLIRMIQSLVEIVFFYHPLVWMVSREITREREACCDDQAVAATGDAFGYALALTRLQRMCNHSKTELTMSVHSHPGPFTARIQRIIRPHAPHPSAASPWSLLLGYLLLLGLSSYGWVRAQSPQFTSDQARVASDKADVIKIDDTYSPEQVAALVDRLAQEDIQLTIEASGYSVAGNLRSLVGYIQFPDGHVRSFVAKALGTLTIRHGKEGVEVSVNGEPDPELALLRDRTPSHAEVVDASAPRPPSKDQRVEVRPTMPAEEGSVVSIRRAAQPYPTVEADSWFVTGYAPSQQHQEVVTIWLPLSLADLSAKQARLRAEGVELTVTEMKQNRQGNIISLSAEVRRGSQSVSFVILDKRAFADIKYASEGLSVHVGLRKAGQSLGSQQRDDPANETPYDQAVLFEINGDLVPESEVKALHPDNIVSIDVFGGKEAESLSGEKGKRGVVRITTKDGQAAFQQLGLDLDIRSEDLYNVAFPSDTVLDGFGDSNHGEGYMTTQAAHQSQLDHPLDPASDLIQVSVDPNPFMETLRVVVSLKAASELVVEVFDLQGKLVETLTNGPQRAGPTTLTWRPRGVSAGTYLIRTVAGKAYRLDRVILTK
jgi:beta-lactamase regulating signal transducer with metallopeptidase domain